MKLLNQIILVIGFIIGSVNSLPIYNHNIAPSYKSPSVYIINNDIQPAIIRQPPSPPGPILYEPLELGPVILSQPQQLKPNLNRQLK